MKAILTLWSIALVIKLVLGAFIPLAADEAYYWFWSRHLQLSYYDHGPFIAWLYKIGQPLENIDSMVRWPGLILGHLSLLFWIDILRPWLDDKKTFIWCLLVFTSPMLGLGALILTPDTPMVFFWSLALWAMLKVLLIEKNKQNFLYYLLIGAALGLGFCSKYLIVLFVPITLIWLGFSGRFRNLKVTGFLATLFTAILFSLPVIIWNYENDFASFGFQLDHGLGKKWKSSWTFEYVVGQALLLFPFIVWLGLKARIPRNFDWLPYFAWSPLIFFFLTSFRGRVEANWPVMAYPAVLVLAVFAISKMRKISWLVGLWMAFITGVLVQIYQPWIPFVHPRKLKTREFHEFDPLVQAVDKYHPFFAGSYQMASKLSFALKKDVYKLHHIRRLDYFDSFEQGKPVTEIYYVAIGSKGKLPRWAYSSFHKVLREIPVSDEYRILEVIRQ